VQDRLRIEARDRLLLAFIGGLWSLSLLAIAVAAAAV
jgi:hypothetical protein